MLSLGLRGRWAEQPFSKTLLPTTNWIIKSQGVSSLLHFPLGESQIHCLLTVRLKKGYWALSIRIRIYCWVPCRAEDSMGRRSSFRATRFRNTFECISMPLVLTQPLRIIIPTVSQSADFRYHFSLREWKLFDPLCQGVTINYAGSNLTGVWFWEMKIHVSLGGFHASETKRKKHRSALQSQLIYSVE